MVNLTGATVRAKPGAEIHAGKVTGEVVARDTSPEGRGALWAVEWNDGPPWRGWYLESELEVEEVSR